MWTAVLLLCACATTAAVTSSSERDRDSTPRRIWAENLVGKHPVEFQREPESEQREGRRVNWIPRRPRRLMGIFRCYGWGPGCYNSPSYIRRQPSEPPASQTTNQQSKTFGQEVEVVKEPELPESKPPSEIRVHQTVSRFHPFFAHTSGGSWARTGKKRDFSRRRTASDRRIDFLKQILRDMLDEQDEEDASLTAADAEKRRRDVSQSYVDPGDVTNPAVDSESNHAEDDSINDLSRLKLLSL